jgi:hypothetical protein
MGLERDANEGSLKWIFSLQCSVAETLQTRSLIICIDILANKKINKKTIDNFPIMLTKLPSPFYSRLPPSSIEELRSHSLHLFQKEIVIFLA